MGNYPPSNIYSLTPPTITPIQNQKLFESPLLSFEKAIDEFLSDPNNRSHFLVAEFLQSPPGSEDLVFYFKTKALVPNEVKGEVSFTQRDRLRNNLFQFIILSESPQVIFDVSHQFSGNRDQNSINDSINENRQFIVTSGFRFDISPSGQNRISFSNQPSLFYRFSLDTLNSSFGIETAVPINQSIHPLEWDQIIQPSQLRQPYILRENTIFWGAYRILPSITLAGEASFCERTSLRGLTQEGEPQVEREKIRQFQKIVLHHSIPDSHQITFSYLESFLTNTSKMKISFFQHNLVRRQIYNPFEERENKYINNIVDISFSLAFIQQRGENNRNQNTNFVLDNRQFQTEIKAGLSWQINKNYLIKFGFNQNAFSFSTVFKSWFNPSISLIFSVSNLKPFRSFIENPPNFGVQVSLSSWLTGSPILFEEPSESYLRTVPVKKRIVNEYRDVSHKSRKPVNEVVK